MRQLVLLAALLLVIVPGASAAARSSTGDGSLAVSDGDGSLVVQGRGVIYGSFAQGTLYVLQYRPDTAGQTISVSGASATKSDGGVTTYSGSAVRFLLPSGRYTLELVATGIDVSAVGRGAAGATAGSSFSAGSLALDGAKPVPFTKVSGRQVFGVRQG